MTTNVFANLPAEIIAEVKRLQYRTRRLVQAGISGNYRSAFRGRGIEFEEVREYVPGDEIRSIDWKVTARSGAPYIKLFREERELNVMIAVDVSKSTATGTRGMLRETLIAQVGAVLTLLAQKNNDRVGLVCFSDTIESYHPARRAQHAIPRILSEVLAPKARKSKTNLAPLTKFLGGVLKRHSILFIISDFMDMQIENSLAALATRHEVVAIMIADESEDQLPRVGIINIYDPESEQEIMVDTNSEFFLQDYLKQAKKTQLDTLASLRREGLDTLCLYTNKPFMPMLHSFFTGRSRKVAH